MMSGVWRERETRLTVDKARSRYFAASAGPGGGGSLATSDAGCDADTEDFQIQAKLVGVDPIGAKSCDSCLRFGPVSRFWARPRTDAMAELNQQFCLDSSF